MTKRSGFAVKITAFIEADPKDMKSMKDAADLVDAAHEHLHFTGFKMVKLDSRFMLSREVPDAVAGPSLTVAPDGPVVSTSYRADGLPEGTLVTPTMPPVPTAMRRT